MNDCTHEFVQGPYLLSVDHLYYAHVGSPYYPPEACVPVQCCRKCGILRISKLDRESIEPSQKWVDKWCGPIEPEAE